MTTEDLIETFQDLASDVARIVFELHQLNENLRELIAAVRAGER